MSADRSELIVRYREQRELLDAAAFAFDGGHRAQALQLATRVRVLVYDEGRGSSLLKALGVKDQMLWRTFRAPFDWEITPEVSLRTSSLFTHVVGGDGGAIVQPIDLGADGRRTSFDEWWRNEIVTSRGLDRLHRNQVVLGLANQDGGAHIDPAKDLLQLLLSTSGHLLADPPLSDAQQLDFARGMLHVQMRTIATEVQHSLDHAEATGQLSVVA